MIPLDASTQLRKLARLGIAERIQETSIPLELLDLEIGGYSFGKLGDSRVRFLVRRSCNLYIIGGLLKARLEGRC